MPPRSSASEYQAHQSAKDAEIGASVVPPDQAARILSADIRKKYLVLEVAIYPRAGRSIDLRTLDFALKTGPAEKSYPAAPQEIASIWREHKPGIRGPGVNVVTETGVVFGRGTNSATGRTDHGWGTYSGVGIDNAPRPYPPASSGIDPYAVEERIRRLALPEGPAAQAIAGYLFFPLLKKRKPANLHLEYYQSGAAIDLQLPTK